MSETPLPVQTRLCLLSAIIGLAALLRLWHLASGATITAYYAAGVRSMLLNVHNLLFNAYDPAGIISLDKPPVAFWIQAGAAEILGYGHFALALPQALEGTASCAILYALVRRHFGDVAGLIAALFLATMPIAVVLDRSNNTDSALLLALMLAAEALDRAVASGRLRTLLLAAGWVGVGFNTKMMVALGVLPGFLAFYWIGACWPVTRRLRHLACAAVVLAGVSLSWAVAFDLVPPAARPFAGSSANNSMLQLIVGHNLVQRFVPNSAAFPRRPRFALTEETRVPAGPLRLLHPGLAEQFGWLLPLVLAAWWRPASIGPLALWTGWLLAYGAVFSAAAGIFHPYYLGVLTPAVAALAAAGLRNIAGRRGAFPLALCLTLAWQVATACGALASLEATEDGFVLAALMVALALLTLALTENRAAIPAAAASLCVIPFAWTLGALLLPGGTHLTARAPIPRLAPPLAWRRPVADTKLLDYLDAQRGGDRFLLATMTTHEADPIIIATGEPVMPIGGFTGNEPVVTLDALATAVAGHQLRFVLVRANPNPRERRRQRNLLDWIRRNGSEVDPALWRDPDAEGRELAVLYDLKPPG